MRKLFTLIKLLEIINKFDLAHWNIIPCALNYNEGGAVSGNPDGTKPSSYTL